MRAVYPEQRQVLVRVRFFVEHLGWPYGVRGYRTS
jgi:hypothetical protein